MTVVHINTEVRLAWRRGLNAAIEEQPNEIVPYKLLPRVVDSVKQVVTARLALFSVAGFPPFICIDYEKVFRGNKGALRIPLLSFQ